MKRKIIARILIANETKSNLSVDDEDDDDVADNKEDVPSKKNKSVEILVIFIKNTIM